MLADGLVDELHLFVYPLTRGPGPRLFPEDATPAKLSLATCESYENGVVPELPPGGVKAASTVWQAASARTPHRA